jgi:nucleotide-binding universal stress UspA family protein
MSEARDSDEDDELRRVLLGFDGSARGVDGLYLARAIAQAEQAELLVACVYEPESIFDAGDRYLSPVDEKRARAKREAEMRRDFSMVEAELGGRRYERRELWGSPARELTLLAEDADVGVVVVGSTHQGAVGRVLIGSVGEKLLHGAPCAVAVAPVGFCETNHFGSRPIGVGYTGSPESREALSWAESLARRLGSGLRLITAIREFNPAHPPGLVGAPDYRTLVRDDVANAQAAAAEEIKDIEVERLIVDGDPAEVLAEQGAELDLLVVGSRGYGPMRRALLGGVSGRIIRTAPCPVVVTPRSAQREPGEGEHPHYVAAQI